MPQASKRDSAVLFDLRFQYKRFTNKEPKESSPQPTPEELQKLMDKGPKAVIQEIVGAFKNKAFKDYYDGKEPAQPAQPTPTVLPPALQVMEKKLNAPEVPPSPLPQSEEVKATLIWNRVKTFKGMKDFPDNKRVLEQIPEWVKSEKRTTDEGKKIEGYFRKAIHENEQWINYKFYDPSEDFTEPIDDLGKYLNGYKETNLPELINSGVSIDTIMKTYILSYQKNNKDDILFIKFNPPKQ